MTKYPKIHSDSIQGFKPEWKKKRTFSYVPGHTRTITVQALPNKQMKIFTNFIFVNKIFKNNVFTFQQFLKQRYISKMAN